MGTKRYKTITLTVTAVNRTVPEHHDVNPQWSENVRSDTFCV